MRAPPKWLLKRAIEALSDHGLMTLADDLKKYLSPKRGTSARRKVAKSKRAERREKTSAVRALVFERAEDQCEVPGDGDGRCCLPASALDHFFGGSERRPMESVESCWALCLLHNREKTANRPSAAWWLEQFIAHGQRHLEAAEGGSDEFFRWAAIVIEAEKRLPKRNAKAALDSMRTGGAL